MEKFSRRLNDALKFRNMKPIELSEKSGIDKGSISSYLSGRYVPKTKNIYNMAEVLNVNPSWLMGYDVSKEPLIDPIGLDMIVDDLGSKYINTTQLSILTGITTKELNDIISGNEKAPKPSSLKKIADALDNDLYDYLIGYGYVEDPEDTQNEIFNTGVRYLLSEEERTFMCKFLADYWNRNSKDKIFNIDNIYDRLFQDDKALSKDDIVDIYKKTLDYTKANEFYLTISEIRNAMVHNIKSSITTKELKLIIEYVNDLTQEDKVTIINMIDYLSHNKKNQ